jgi:CubicO group peptidase (beta-lactamase class C family)
MTAKGRRAMVRVLVVLLVVLTGCSAQLHQPRIYPSPSDRTQEIGAAIDAYVAGWHYGATRAILVSYRGRLVAERYYHSRVDDHAEVRSVTKSVMATLVGAALREGRLHSIDATLGDLLPQYRSIMDARTERITVRQLLTQTAGYTDKQVNETVPNRPTVPQLLKPGPQNPPGAGFEYQDGGPHLLSAVIAEVTGQTHWTMPDGCCSSRLISKPGLPTKARSSTSTSPRWRRSKPSDGCAIMKASTAGPSA